MAVASNRNPDLFKDSAVDLVAAFEPIKTTEQFTDYFQCCVQSAGFQYFLIGGVPSDIEPIAKMILLHNYPKHWVDRYIQQDLIHIDPVAQYSHETTEPFFWSEAENFFKSDSAYRKFMAQAADAGLKWGICVPIHNINGCEAVISLAANEQCIGVCDLPLIQLFCTYAFHKAKLLKKSEIFKAKELTRREKEILACAVVGRTAAETSAILRISEPTVAFHLQNAMHKLGARNKIEAVAEAIRQRFITI